MGMNAMGEKEPKMRPPAIYRSSQVTPYVLFLVGRVGSTYLVSMLRSHPALLAGEEDLRDLEDLGAQVQLDWADKYLSPPILGTRKARGFNVKLAHLCDPDGFRELLQKRRCKILHMQRRNRVKAVISRINGSRLYDQTGMWGLFDERDKLPPLTVDLAQFDEFLNHRERMDAQLEAYVKSLQLPTIEIFYEDLLSDRSAFLEALFRFLDVPFVPVKGVTLKITNDDLSQVITNFDELQATYKGTPYYSMFEQGRAT
jgi:LPS sulfotransferase NodH